MKVHDKALQFYMEMYPAHHAFREKWPVQGQMAVGIGLADAPPPMHVSSSILAIVLDAKSRVLFLWPSNRSGNISHVLIGGRPKPEESPEETAMREVGEETGWRIVTGKMIGYRHFHQLEPESPHSDRPYPDFVQPVHTARALSYDHNLLILRDQIPAIFLDFSDVVASTDPAHRPLLIAAAEVCPKSKA